MSKGTSYKKLTRADLRNFDDLATEAVLVAMKHGAVGRVNSNGHAFIRAATGTMSITRDISSKPNDAKNVQRDLRRLFPEIRQNGSAKKDANMQSQVSPTFTESSDQVTMTEEQLLQCPAKGCDKEFATEGARYSHVRDDHATCSWEGPDVTHDDPNYRCDLGPNGSPFVGKNGMSVAGHANIYHVGNKPWEKRDPAKRLEAAKKGAATRAANRQAAVNGANETVVSAVPDAAAKPAAKPVEQPSQEHRGLPTGEVKHRPTTPAAKLAAIRAILGEDPKVAQLQAEVDELRAHLELVREALNLDSTPNRKKK